MAEDPNTYYACDKCLWRGPLKQTIATFTTKTCPKCGEQVIPWTLAGFPVIESNKISGFNSSQTYVLGRLEDTNPFPLPILKNEDGTYEGIL